MLTRCMLWLILTLIGAPILANEEGPSTLPIGAQAPDFCLPGIDDNVHCLKDYASSKVLVLIFTCNHCPTAQLYERSEEHTSELQSRLHLVCRLLLEKKKKRQSSFSTYGATRTRDGPRQ